jgi:benzodiazapine receptor
MASVAGSGATRVRSAVALVILLVVCLGAGWLGSQFPPGEWYSRLAKPSWTPPNWLFGPVWSVLYVAMAVAAWLVWRRLGIRGAAVPLAVFAVQLVLNAVWSWLFFGLHRPGLAFAELVLLWLAILLTLVVFWRRSTLAGALMLPYLAWVTYAASLNLGLWLLNT